MDLEYWMIRSIQWVDPCNTGHEEEQWHHKIEHWQWHLGGRQVVAIVVLGDVGTEWEHIVLWDVELVVGACMEQKIVEAFVFERVDSHHKLK